MKMNRHEITVSTVCPFCGKEHEVEINEIDYYAYINGEALIQDAFPYLSADEREMLKTGICGTCWDEMFGIPTAEDLYLDEEE